MDGSERSAALDCLAGQPGRGFRPRGSGPIARASPAVVQLFAWSSADWSDSRYPSEV